MKLKVWTIVGTRPEIIRMAPTIKLFDKIFDHTLIHTGQNKGFSMSDVFFQDLDLRRPDHFFGSAGSNLGELIGDMFVKFSNLLQKERPEAFVVLGDTNSALLTILARRERIPTYHLEAGNRSFDARVPEEINRKIIDHAADFNLAYSSYSHENLLREGLNPRTTFISGSPMLEVISSVTEKIEASEVLNELKLSKNQYFVCSIHRQENVEDRTRLKNLILLLGHGARKYDKKLVISVHPRTNERIAEAGLTWPEGSLVAEPFGLIDYLRLQRDSFATISDSGTLAEESAILGFLGLSPRESTERPEAFDLGLISLVGDSFESLDEAIDSFNYEQARTSPIAYQEQSFSRRVANIILSTARNRNQIIGDEIELQQYRT